MNLVAKARAERNRKKSAAYVLSSILLLHSNLCSIAMAETLPITPQAVVAAAPTNTVQGSQQQATSASTILPSALTNALNSEPVFLDIRKTR